MNQVSNSDIYFALTGLPACGKETFKDFLFEACREKGFLPFHVSFTDVLRQECQERGLECNRENYTKVANELRAQHGSDILAERIVEIITKIQANDPNHKKIFVMEAVRNPRESELFKTRLGKRCLLVALTSSREDLISRIQSRKRADDQPGVLDSRKVAEDLLDREFGTNQPITGIRVGDCIEAADVRIDNSKGLEQLMLAAKDLLSAALQ